MKRIYDMFSVLGVVLIAAASAGNMLAVENYDWPNFRGPDHNGISKETEWNPAAIAGAPKVAWKIDVGQGWSSVSIFGDKLFTMGNVNDQDIVYALNPKDGKEIWRHSYACKAGNYPGPRSTPVTDGKVVYTLSRDGIVLCLNVEDGKVVWQKNIFSEYGSEDITWGLAGSPVIYGDMLLLNAGETGAALDRKTGAKIWGSSGKGGYSTPLVYKHDGRDCVALFSCKGLCIVEAKTGKKLAFVEWVTKYDINAADPIYSNGKIFISSGYGRGCALVDISGAQPKTVWEHKDLKTQFSSSVLINGNIYGIDGNNGGGYLKCMDFATGKEKWSKNLGFGNLMSTEDKLIILNESGSLFVVTASSESGAEIASAKNVLGKTCWTAPVLCRGIMYCRNSKGNMVAIDVRK